MTVMRRVLVLALLAAALVAAPAARLVASAACSGPGPMDCCAGTGDDDGSAPCHCSLKPVLPAPAALDVAPVPAVVLAEAILPAIDSDAPSAPTPGSRVVPRARSAPLHLLYSVLLV